MSSLSKLLRVNWIKTLSFNFKYLPFSDAVKLPFMFWGNVRTVCTKGGIRFNCPVRTGMVRIGHVSVPWQSGIQRSSYINKGKHLILGDLALGGVLSLRF